MSTAIMANVFPPVKMAIGVNVIVDIQAMTARQKMKVFLNKLFIESK
jgi:hypothetical protein